MRRSRSREFRAGPRVRGVGARAAVERQRAGLLRALPMWAKSAAARLKFDMAKKASKVAKAAGLFGADDAETTGRKRVADVSAGSPAGRGRVSDKAGKAEVRGGNF